MSVTVYAIPPCATPLGPAQVHAWAAAFGAPSFTLAPMRIERPIVGRGEP